VRLSASGRYEAKIESIAMIGSACEMISVRLGRTLLRVLADPSDGTMTGLCRLDIDPGSLQLWQFDAAAPEG
jgi:hypothetical protein